MDFCRKLSFERESKAKVMLGITGVDCFSTENILPAYFQAQKSPEIEMWKGIFSPCLSSPRVKSRSVFLL